VNIPGGRLTSSTTLTLVAHTPGRGTWEAQVPVTVVPISPLAYPNDPVITLRGPGSALSTNGLITLTGEAYDRNNTGDGSGVDRVEVFLDGQRGDPNAIGLGQATLARSTQTGPVKEGAATWTLQTGQFGTGLHTLNIYARSSVTGKQNVLTHSFEIDKPSST
jgi:hypothetical protein